MRYTKLILLSTCLTILFVVPFAYGQETQPVLKPNQLVTFSLAPGEEKTFVLQMEKGDLAKIESLAPDGIELSLDIYDNARKESLSEPLPMDSVWFVAQTDGEFLFVIGFAKDQHPEISGTQRISVQYTNKFKLPAGTNLRLDSITVPTSLAGLVGKLGRSYITHDDQLSGNYYIWKFQNGLEISAVSGGEYDEPFNGITISSESQQPIPNCPFGFVLNQTSFSEVNSRFNKKLRKLEYQDGFKVYSARRWNHFYFKNKKLVKITIAKWEEDKVN